MLARVLVLVVALGVSYGEEKHEPKTVLKRVQPKEFRFYFERMPVKQQQEASQQELQYQAPESHEQPTYSNSIAHEVNEQQESQENTGHLVHHPQASIQYVPVPVHEEQLSQHIPQQHQSQHISQQHQAYDVPIHQESQPVQVPVLHKVLAHHPVRPVKVHRIPVYQHQASSHSDDSHEQPIDYYAHPKYQYEYNVDDPHTGDRKFQHEVRDGDVVRGVYSFHEADGSIRTVEYTSDKHHGFNAVVKHTAPGHHSQENHHH